LGNNTQFGCSIAETELPNKVLGGKVEEIKDVIVEDQSLEDRS
jgi:hypothetical protein